MNEPTVLCRVREGMRFGAENQYGPGDVIELPASALTAFGDKLEQMEAPMLQPEPKLESEPKRQRKDRRTATHDS